MAFFKWASSFGLSSQASRSARTISEDDTNILNACSALTFDDKQHLRYYHSDDALAFGNYVEANQDFVQRLSSIVDGTASVQVYCSEVTRVAATHVLDHIRTTYGIVPIGTRPPVTNRGPIAVHDDQSAVASDASSHLSAHEDMEDRRTAKSKTTTPAGATQLPAGGAGAVRTTDSKDRDRITRQTLISTIATRHPSLQPASRSERSWPRPAPCSVPVISNDNQAGAAIHLSSRTVITTMDLMSDIDIDSEMPSISRDNSGRDLPVDPAVDTTVLRPRPSVVRTDKRSLRGDGGHFVHRRRPAISRLSWP
ncbi:hypothetical protein IAT40_003426 [Kwoniella sp. CBS 6097]